MTELKDWSWIQLIAAWHDYHPRAGGEILRRLMALAPPDKLERGYLEFRWKTALEAEWLYAWDKPAFTMNAVLEPYTGGKVRVPVLDWEALALGKPELCVKRALDAVRSVVSEYEKPAPKVKLGLSLVRAGFESFEEMSQHGAEPQPTAAIHLPSIPPTIAYVLVAFNRWNQKRRPADPTEFARSKDLDGCRVPARRLADGEEFEELRRAVDAEGGLDAERQALRTLMNSLLTHGPEAGAPRCSESGLNALPRVRQLVAVWLLNSFNKVHNSYKRRPIYRPKGLREDTNEVLKAWGYPNPDSVLRRGQKVDEYESMERAIQAAILAAKEC